MPDVNLLLYAFDERSPHHRRAREWFEELISDVEPVGFAWLVLLAFLRLSTRAQLTANPIDVAEALDIVEGWVAQPARWYYIPRSVI